MPNPGQPPTLEEFRKFVSQEYLSKGITPPTPSSPEELHLYNLYLKGWQNIHSSDASR